MRLIEDQANSSQYSSSDTEVGVENARQEDANSVDLVAAILRYRWAVLLPALLGGVIGCILWTQLPEIWESSTWMLVESEQPIMLDSVTGDVVRAIPDADVIRAQLFSDRVLDDAENHDVIADPAVRELLDEEYGGSFRRFIFDVLEFDAGGPDKKNANSMVFVVSAQHTSDIMPRAAVIAMTDSLRDYYSNGRKSSIGELKTYIDSAFNGHREQVEKLEKDYAEWQKNAKLNFSALNGATNPHAVEADRLQQLRDAVERDLAADTRALTSIISATSENEDKRTALETVGQILGLKLYTPPDVRRGYSSTDQSYELRKLDNEREILPLRVQREAAIQQYGENHFSVVDFNRRIKALEEELERLNRGYSEQVLILDEKLAEREQEEAEEALRTVVAAFRARIEDRKLEIQRYNQDIARERAKAADLAQAEEEYKSWERKLEGARALLQEIQGQMQRLDLTDTDNGVELSELMKPTPPAIVGPNLLLLVVGGIGIGLLAGCSLAYLLESQAGTFRNADDLSAVLRLPILAHIPFDPGRVKRIRGEEQDPIAALDEKLAVVHRPSSMAAEATRACRTAVFFEAAASNAKIVQVTSPLPSDGKTTIAGNLAASIAQAGKRVLLIDADLRRPQLSDNFALSAGLGLTNVLNGDCDPIEAYHPTPVKNLFVMPSGPIPVNPAEALSLPETAEMLQWARDEFDLVIVDTPPLLVVTDASIMASLVDGVLLTVKIRRKSKVNAMEAVGILRGVSANIFGVIVNASDDGAGSDGYRGYGYYRYSRYASKYNVTSGYGGERTAYGNKRSSQKPTIVVAGKAARIADQRASKPASNNGSQQTSPKDNGSVGLLGDEE